jgi:hypothetical protein
MIDVEETDVCYVLSFTYHPEIVADVRVIPGRRFDPDTKRWRIPLTRRRDVERLVGKWNTGGGTADTKAVVAEPYVSPDTVYPTCTRSAPWAHQLTYLRYMWNKQGTLVHLAAGSGKSKVLIDYCLNHPGVERVLIVCPLPFVSGWPHMWETHGGRPVSLVALGSLAGTVVRKRGLAEACLAAARRENRLAVVVVNYESIWRGSEDIHVQRDGAGNGNLIVKAPKHKDVVSHLRRMGLKPGTEVWTSPFSPALEEDLARLRTWWHTRTGKGGDLQTLGDWAFAANFDVVACDEIQRLRGQGSEQSTYMAQLARQVPVRIGLSGTPFPESPLDAYGVCRFLDPTLFPSSYGAFERHYAIKGGYGNYQVLGYIRQAELQEKIATLKIDVAPSGYDLPPSQDIQVPLILPEKVRRLYGQLDGDLYARLDAGEITIAHAGVAITRLQQVTSGYLPLETSKEEETEDHGHSGGAGNDDCEHAAHSGALGSALGGAVGAVGTHNGHSGGHSQRHLERLHEAKADALAALFDSTPLTEPWVVFARFHYDLARIHEVAAACGRTSKEISGRPGRPAMALDAGVWRPGPETVLVVQGESGVEGIDLTRACRVVYYSHCWQLGKYEQSRARILRAGQTRPCFFYHLTVQDTVDEQIQHALASKKGVLELLLASRKG